jgi:aryl-alcohol dehydrogenase-like predicted oxidoreductase
MEPGYDIYEYSRRGHLDDLRDALAAGSRPDEYMAYDGSTALVMAARQGHAPVVRELAAHGASTTVRTEEGSTMLHHAVSGGSADCVRAMLEAGVAVDEPNEDGVTPLLLAAHYGAEACAALLCEAGADINHCAEGWGTPLDGAQGAMMGMLEARGAKRSEQGADQPMASAAERFNYGCFDTGENPNATPDLAPAQERAPQAVRSSGRPQVGDLVRLRAPKAGLLKEGDVGTVAEDDGSDCIPLKVKLGDAHDYYDVQDVVVCEPELDLGPDSDRATPEGTARRATSRKLHSAALLGSTGLTVSPAGFGCHRVDGENAHADALKLAIHLGCNLVDLAPNYTDGQAEVVVGKVLKELFDAGKLRRDEIIVATKVGNVLGQQMQHTAGVPNMAMVNDNLWHCISPEWIEQELTRSLERLQLKCVDCLLLHCPEYEAKASGIDMAEVYARLGRAFMHLEREVDRGRVAFYGISAAFYPLRPTDAEHLDLEAIVAQLPEAHHFRALQFPLNFAEAKIVQVGHTPRNPDGSAVNRERAQSAPTLLEAARKYGLATLTNRPLDGIYKEAHGVLRFSSLDCNERSFSELQLDNCDQLEEKLTRVCRLAEAPFHASSGAGGHLAAKTVKVLSSLDGVDCVLLGMRRPEYVVDALPFLFSRPPVPAEDAAAGVRALHGTLEMWFATAIAEADHGTAKDWRLPMDGRGDASSKVVGA